MKAILPIAVFLVAAALPAAPVPGGDILSVHAWCELEPMFQGRENRYPLSAEEARRLVLEEARQALSGMIYGYEFSYTPPDSGRRVAESFTLTPLAEVRWGDPHLRVAAGEVRDSFLFLTVRYQLRPFQEARREAWASNVVPTASGRGEHSVFDRPAGEGKRLALQEAVKEALRNHLRPIVFNKPREVRGEVLLWEEPRTSIHAGAYRTEVTVKVRIVELRPYSIF